MKRDDGISFKQMKTLEITQIIQELESELGLFDKGGVTLAPGGDLFIRPTTKEQQVKLLKVNYALNGTIMVTCTQPRSANNSRVTIHQVPTGDTDDEIYQTLKHHGYRVNSVYRFKIDRGSGKIPTTTVAIEFEGSAPKEILLNGISFSPRPYIPGPPRLRCTNCGGKHEDMPNCTAPSRCINCEGNHPASSPSCPQFLRMKIATRTQQSDITEKGITHYSHQSSHLTYSQVLRGNASSSAIDPETEIINGKIEAIQTELKQIRAELYKVKALEGKVANMDLTVRKVESTLSTLETGQLASNLKLDKICLILTKLLPNLDDEEMDIEQPVEDPSKGTSNVGSGSKTASTMTRLAPAKNQTNEGRDPASKKPKSSLDPKTTTRK
ncbi:hypothetical protein GHT06_021639 [Daphnia sinensis]|uniref:Pre-C2HC domain-containing protein n=1 Tax=Daphnia sinensis TaxID=1820382 RepID=A0AAD5PQY3_9CRUS|nr:hypothetical protein GHT06_021639 [Daphnia sinensis]